MKKSTEIRTVKQPKDPRLNMLVLALACLPAIWLASFISQYAVNTFHSDQWCDTLPTVANFLNGTLHFSDLTHQNGEHRSVIPKLLTLGLGILTHWNILAETWVMFALAAITLFNIWNLCKLTEGNIWLLPIASLLLFSPLGYENWMLSYQTCFWLPMACFTGALWLAMLPWRFITTGALSVVATFSIASGFTCWLIALPMLWVYGGEKKAPKLAIWLAVLVACVFAYLWGYTHAASTAGLNPLLEHPGNAILFFVSYFGNPFAQGLPFRDYMAERVIGGVLFAIFLVLAGAAWRQKRIGACLPWFMLASASMLTAAMTTVGRSNVPSQPSRYIPFAVLFTIAVLFLSRNKSITIAIAASLITLNIVGALACTPNWISQQHFFAMNKSLVQLVDVVDETKLLPDSIIVNLDDVNKTIARINALDKHGYILPPVLHTNTILLISDGNVHPECGLSHFGKTQDGQLAMAGIGQLEGRCADMILLTQNGQIFSVAYVNPATKEWAKIFTPTELHEQPQAWAFDAEKQVAYLLPLQP